MISRATARDTRDRLRDRLKNAETRVNTAYVTDVTDVTGTPRTCAHERKCTNRTHAQKLSRTQHPLSRLSRLSRALYLRGFRRCVPCHVACHVRVYPVTSAFKEKMKGRAGQ